jgi:hypothetical protein
MEDARVFTNQGICNMKTSFAVLALAGLAFTAAGCAKPDEPKPVTPAAPSTPAADPAAPTTPPAGDAAAPTTPPPANP